jgi:hypothetical protein
MVQTNVGPRPTNGAPKTAPEQVQQLRAVYRACRDDDKCLAHDGERLVAVPAYLRNLIDFALEHRYLVAAAEAIDRDPSDPADLAVLADWFADILFAEKNRRSRRRWRARRSV